MANNLIQIKRSLNTATPTSLANGELAYTANGDHLFIGSNGVVVAIGGKQNPGVLTANQALVSNSTGYIDAVKTANLTVQSITANGVYSPGAGYLLSVDGGGNTYWLPQGSITVNTAAQYTWTNTHSFTNTTVSSNTSTGTVTIGGGLGVAGRINTGDLAAGNDSVYSSLTGTTLSTANVFATSTVNAAVVSVGTSVVGNSSGVYTTGTVNGAVVSVGTQFIANTTQVSLSQGMKLSANGALGSANQVLRSDSSGTVYWSEDAGDISSVTAGSGLTGGGTSGDVTLDVGAGNGIAVDADSIRAVAGVGIASNSSGIHVVGNNGIIANSSGVFAAAANGISVDSSGINVNGGSTLTVNSSGVHVNSALSITDLTLAGNLIVSGTLTTVNTTNLAVTDSLIKLANGNSVADSLDIGLYGMYGASGTKYTGLFRDATDGVYKIFGGLTVEPTTTVDTADGSYTIGTLQSYINSGALISNSTAVAITANASVNVAIVANNLSWSGLAQNGIIYGGASGAFTSLSAGAGGTVLMVSTSGVPEFATLDGGTF